MIEGDVDVLIAKPPEAVFAFVSDPRSELVWNPSAVAIDRLSTEPTGVGSRFHGRYKGAGAFDIEITKYEVGRRTTSVGTSRFLSYTLNDGVEHEDGGCRLRRSMTGTFKGPMKLMEPVLAPVFRRRFRDSAARIRQALESGLADGLPYTP